MNSHVEIIGRSHFSYPDDFIETINLNPAIDIEPWWFIVFEDGNVNYWYHTLKKLYPQRELIPFAKFNANDDIACFDGRDESGNPGVLIIHAYASEGWELHGSYGSFKEWLNEAIQNHAAWEEEE